MAKWDIWLTYGVSIELPDDIDPNDDKNWNEVYWALSRKLQTISADELAGESEWEIKKYEEGE